MQEATRVTRRTATGASGAAVAVLAFKGDIASTSKEAILDAYHALGADVKALALDFSGSEYINSSGIAIMIQLLMAAKTAGQTVGIFGLSAHFTKVFTLVGVSKYARLSPDEPALLATL